MTGIVGLYSLLRRFEPCRGRLSGHPLYASLRSVEDVRVFMDHHIYAVWDFMSLLKGLQRHLTCMETAWRPVGVARTRRLVNELILEEETDEIDGEATSHFEFYLRAMRRAGADTTPIETLLRELDAGADLETALVDCGAPAACRQFVRTTFGMINSGKPHVVAAAFTFGREEAIPGMFGGLLRAIPDEDGVLDGFKYYLDRHIELDGSSHAPKAVQMLADLCGEDNARWAEAADTAVQAVEARLELWDAVAGLLARRQEGTAQGAAPRLAAVA
jgi:hypothetical protein